MTYTSAVENLEHSTSSCYHEQINANKEVNPHHKTAHLHVNFNKKCSVFFPMCLVHGLCSGTAVHGSASQSICVELAAHRSGVLRQRQSSALLLHTDVWFEGRPSLDWLSDHCCPVCWNGHDTIWLTSCMSDTEIVKYWCFSTGGEAGLGAGALQPNCLLFATAELSYLSCRCKQTSIWSSNFTLSGYAVKPLIMHLFLLKLLFLFHVISYSFLKRCRTVKSDWTLPRSRKQKPSKMLSRRKSTKDTTGKVSEVIILTLNVYFLELENMKCIFNAMIHSHIRNNNMFSYVFLGQYVVFHEWKSVK